MTIYADRQYTKAELRRIEREVKINAMKLDKFLASNALFVQKNIGKYIIFHDDVQLVAPDFETAMKFGDSQFGAIGFVVRQIEHIKTKDNRRES